MCIGVQISKMPDSGGKPPVIGLLGGTFDPIHLGHLRVAEEACDWLNLDQVWLILSARPPHKQSRQVVSIQHRWEMLRLACQDNPRLVPCDLEMQRQGPSYTIDTVREIQDRMGNQAKVYLLIGVDCASEIKTWKDWQEILKSTEVRVFRRGMEDQTRIPAEIDSCVEYLDIPCLEISSSQIRVNIALGRSIRYLVPGSVYSYLSQHRLYLGAGGNMSSYHTENQAVYE